MRERSIFIVSLMVAMMLLLSVLGFAKDPFWGNVEHGDSNMIENFDFYEDGTSATRIGNFKFYSNGVTENNIGSFTFRSDGESSTQIGTFHFRSSGNDVTDIGKFKFNTHGPTIMILMVTRIPQSEGLLLCG